MCSHHHHHTQPLLQRGGPKLVDLPNKGQLVSTNAFLLSGSWGLELRSSGLATSEMKSHLTGPNFKFYLLDFETGFYAYLTYHCELLVCLLSLPECRDYRQVLGIKPRPLYSLGKHSINWVSPTSSPSCRAYKSLSGLSCCWQVG